MRNIYWIDENKLNESCIRSSLKDLARKENLTPHEIDHAVSVGLKLIDDEHSLNWGQIVKAGVAAVKAKRKS